MRRYEVGEHPTQIESSEHKSAEAGLRDQGLQVLARLIVRSHMRKNFDFGRVGHEVHSGTTRQESLPSTAQERYGYIIKTKEG